MSSQPAFSSQHSAKAADRYFTVDANELEALTTTGAQPLFKVPVRTRDGEVYAMAFAATGVDCLARAKKIAAVEAMLEELEPTATVLKTVATVLAQAGKTRAAMALDDTFTRVLRVIGKARGGAH